MRVGPNPMANNRTRHAREAAVDPGGQRYRVQSLGRALDLLELVAGRGKDGARLTELAGALGLSKAATFAILQTLLAHGFVADSTGGSRRYRLGLSLARLGDLAVGNIALAEVALPVLRELTGKCGLTSRAAILDDGYAIVIGRVDAPGAVRFDAALGRRELPHCSAVGKALLAAQPAEEAKSMLRKIGLPRRTPKTITNLASLMNDLAETARRGYAVDDEEDTDGVACIGACVFDRTGKAVGAISVTGLKPRDWSGRQEALAREVMRSAERISRLLGSAPPDARAVRARMIDPRGARA
jgi:IclR family transcriptional regulator, acetate operon repressor